LRKRNRPAGWYRRRFAAAKRAGVRCGAGKDNAFCGTLHLITASGGASPQGEAFGLLTIEKPSPRGEGAEHSEADEVYPPQRKTPLVFPQKNGGNLRTSQQSGRPMAKPSHLRSR